MHAVNYAVAYFCGLVSLLLGVVAVVRTSSIGLAVMAYIITVLAAVNLYFAIERPSSNVALTQVVYTLPSHPKPGCIQFFGYTDKGWVEGTQGGC
jgi:hypothetical protein